jgi:hypothetical protein
VSSRFGGDNGRDHAIGYAKTRQGFGQGQIRVLNVAGEVTETIRFDDREKSALKAFSLWDACCLRSA